MPAHPVDGGVKLSAGWLLDACGFKGARLGGAGFHDRHALVLVNQHDASFDDVTMLAAQARTAVQARYGVKLEQEPETMYWRRTPVPRHWCAKLASQQLLTSNSVAGWQVQTRSADPGKQTLATPRYGTQARLCGVNRGALEKWATLPPPWQCPSVRVTGPDPG